MNKTFIPLAFASLVSGPCLNAMATEVGTVISRTPAYAQIAVPDRQCFEQEQTRQAAPSGAGALVGAIAGGIVGNALGGRGAERAAATGIGMMAGSVIGNQAEANGAPPVTNTVQRCQIVNRYENRQVGFDVVYEYHGQRYSARMPNDPGDTIALNVNVAPLASAPVAIVPPPAVTYMQPPVPTVVYVDPTYAPPVYYSPSIRIGMGWGYYRGGR